MPPAIQSETEQIVSSFLNTATRARSSRPIVGSGLARLRYVSIHAPRRKPLIFDRCLRNVWLSGTADVAVVATVLMFSESGHMSRHTLVLDGGTTNE